MKQPQDNAVTALYAMNHFISPNRDHFRNASLIRMCVKIRIYHITW